MFGRHWVIKWGVLPWPFWGCYGRSETRAVVTGYPKFSPTPPKFNIAPWEMMVRRLFSFWGGNFSGAMLNLAGVSGAAGPHDFLVPRYRLEPEIPGSKVGGQSLDRNLDVFVQYSNHLFSQGCYLFPRIRPKSGSPMWSRNKGAFVWFNMAIWKGKVTRLHQLHELLKKTGESSWTRNSFFYHLFSNWDNWWKLSNFS